jgi:hypothetical protein
VLVCIYTEIFFLHMAKRSGVLKSGTIFFLIGRTADVFMDVTNQDGIGSIRDRDRHFSRRWTFLSKPGLVSLIPKFFTRAQPLELLASLF